MQDQLANYSASAFGSSPYDITNIDASILSIQGTINAECRDFMSYIASISYTNSQSAVATAWAKSHIYNGGDTIINGVNFRLVVLAKPVRQLKITF